MCSTSLNFISRDLTKKNFNLTSTVWPTSSPRSIVTRVVHVVYNVVFEVNRDNTVFFVVHVDYDVLCEVVLDQPIFEVVHVEYDVLSEINRDQTMIWVVHVVYDVSSSRSIVTRHTLSTHPLDEMKEFFEHEWWILKNHRAHAQKNCMILVLREYASQNFSALTPRPENISSRRSKRIFRR